MNKKYIIIAVAALLLGSVIGYALHSSGSSSVVKGTSNTSALSSASLAIGSGCDYSYTTCTGTTIKGFLTGTTTLIVSNFATVPASTTLQYDIAVPGIVFGDIVMANVATSTPGNGGWTIKGASASTTAGYATVSLVNETGAARAIPASTASSTQYLVIKLY